MKTYTELLEKYKRPLDIALALGIVKESDDYQTKCKASSRVCMWRKQGIGKKWQAKLAELDKINLLPPG